ncbi:hypothetical protein, partial [uncultured Microbacterium sp.]|uniref:hypothetical protein n=1 Tax=uncultured Microbacterium sp. TaxID=191216 RepID=UPI0025F2B091
PATGKPSAFRAVRVGDDTHHHGQLTLPFGDPHGTRYAQGVAESEKDAELLTYMHAERIIAATGAYAGAVKGAPLKPFCRRIISVGSFIVATRPLTDAEVASNLDALSLGKPLSNVVRKGKPPTA